MLLKPSDDTKAAAGLVESRNHNGCGRMEAVEFRSSDPWTVLPVLAAAEQHIGTRVDCIAIDEGQFVQDLFRLCPGFCVNVFPQLVCSWLGTVSFLCFHSPG
jgi:thymidine kinase